MVTQVYALHFDWMRGFFGYKVGGANGCEGDCCVNLWGKCCDVTKNVYIWEIFFKLP